jgi:5-methylcytosine-specific restriction protein A
LFQGDARRLGWTAGEQPVAKRNALPNATAYHQDMPDGPRRIDWEWEEIVLACDLVAQNGWRQLGAGDPRVRELSGLLQRMSMHTLEARLPNFRNAAGVARKTNNIATVHPDYVGPPSNGNKLDKRVLDKFLDDPEQMHRFALRVRHAAERDEPRNFSQLVGDEYESVLEGRYLLRWHRVRERKPALREKKIRSVQARGDALACEACGFDFGQTYGDRGQGFIECHHVDPLHQTGERATTIRDLALLCSNCHRMIHRKPPWPTPAQLRDIIHGQPSLNS